MILYAAIGVAYLRFGIRLWQRIVMRPLEQTETPDLERHLYLEQRVQALSADAICAWVAFVLFWPVFCLAGFCLSRLSP
ncbi:hypothetical protein QKW60_01595 [Defluviimonas aestuarii]|uniref:hypothetical protein n=1 Tax=Albidovulum aestuarii TaxID=1130726 RepID=UPI00249AFA7D|nr:hypothetical protein [Defluviimonas aestuarii]MDI3335087.1 hypothetical protein [Defluviimonas aestuarii]